MNKRYTSVQEMLDDTCPEFAEEFRHHQRRWWVRLRKWWLLRRFSPKEKPTPLPSNERSGE